MKSDDRAGDGVAWRRGPLLGKGSFGRVYKARNRRPNYNSLPSEIAVKSAELSVSDTLEKEKEIMNSLRGCPYVIRCFGVETTLGRNTDQAYYNLLLEYASGGSLADRIKASELPEVEVKAHARSLLRGLKHIHDREYVHCDLKPGNILLVEKGGTAKIVDFSLAKKAESLPYPRGTMMYLSPEAVIDLVQEAPSDIWALGCVVLEMLTGRKPWDGKNSEEILRSKMLTGRKPWDGKNSEEILRSIKAEDGMPCIDPKDVVSDEARDFLKHCFVRNSMLRFTAEMLLSHPFVKGLSDDNCDDAVGELLEKESNDCSTVVESADDDGFSCSHLLLDDSFSASSSGKFADIFRQCAIVAPSNTRAGLDESNEMSSQSALQRRWAYPAANFSIAAGV